MRETTRIIRSTLSPAVAGEAMHHGPVFAAPFHTPGDPAAAPYSYARSHNPTWTALEEAIAGLESGRDEGAAAEGSRGKELRARALVFGSGMAAVAAVFGAVLRAGDVVVVPSDAYFAARVLLEQQFVPRGVTVRTAPTAEMAAAGQEGLFEGARLVWVETPSNPTMEVTDIRAVCAAAHAAGALVAVDNTTATPLGQSPLALGADLSMCSDTKLMTGHGDLLLGHVAVRAGAVMGRALTFTTGCWGGGRRWARSWGRWRRGWRCARWRRCRCGRSGAARMRWRWRSSCRAGRRWRRCGIRG